MSLPLVGFLIVLLLPLPSLEWGVCKSFGLHEMKLVRGKTFHVGSFLASLLFFGSVCKLAHTLDISKLYRSPSSSRHMTCNKTKNFCSSNEQRVGVLSLLHQALLFSEESFGLSSANLGDEVGMILLLTYRLSVHSQPTT